jgi:hypothetical protein
MPERTKSVCLVIPETMRTTVLVLVEPDAHQEEPRTLVVSYTYVLASF